MDLKEKLLLLQQQIQSLKEHEADIKAQIVELNKNTIEKKLNGKDYGCGSFTHDGIKFARDKKVEYDQTGLAEMYRKIAATNENPEEYIEIKYSISERKYAAWPTSIKEQFEPLRTVTPQPIKITLAGEK